MPGETTLVVPDDTDDRPAPEHDPRPPRRGRSDAVVRGRVHAARTSSTRRTTKVVLAPQQTAALDRAALRLGRPEGARRRSSAARTCRRATALEEGGLRITSTLDVTLQAIAEKWVKAAAFVPNARNPGGAPQDLGLTYEPWMQNLRGKDLHNGALVAIDYQTGEIDRLRRQRGLLRDDAHARVPAPVRRRRQRLAPAGIGVQAVQLPDRASTTRR